MPVLINFVAFQIGWFACVLGGAQGLPWLGTAVALAIVGWHVGRASRPRTELALVVTAAAIGAVWDSALVALGFLQYPHGTLLEGTAPHWIVALWMLFATTLNVSLRWLQEHMALASLCGALAGPFAYIAGQRLGGVVIPDVTLAVGTLALGWAAFTPLLLLLAKRINGIRPPAKADCPA
jgi:hypothetical protein